MAGVGSKGSRERSRRPLRRKLTGVAAISVVAAAALPLGAMAASAAPDRSTALGASEGLSAYNITVMLSQGLPDAPVITSHDSVVDPSAGVTYVINGVDGTLTLVDSSTGVAMKALAVGSLPDAVAADWSTHRLFVANFADNTISVVDATTGSVVATVKVGQGPSALTVVGPQGQVVVTNALDGTTSVLTESTGVAAIVHLPTVPTTSAPALGINVSLQAGGSRPTGSVTVTPSSGPLHSVVRVPAVVTTPAGATPSTPAVTSPAPIQHAVTPAPPASPVSGGASGSPSTPISGLPTVLGGSGALGALANATGATTQTVTSSQSSGGATAVATNTVTVSQGATVDDSAHAIAISNN